jgi:alkylation response protein AidB-like acyl-CoA dehydrogenase
VDFDDTPQEAAFRAEARSWLESHAKEKGSEMKLSLYHDPSPEADAESVRRSKEWQRTLYEGGWAGITWPVEYGGRGGTPIQQMIFDQEQARFDVSAGAFAVGIGMVGPTLIAHGTEEQKKRYLEPLLRGDEVWCQLFSEPGAGSDLAGLTTRAVRDGDEWVVNGQKVWNSGAHHSQLGILLARTDPTVSKHAGITYFLVDMSTPGIDVRPLVQATGVAHFNEVFLTDVHVPAANVVGEANGGWTVARTTLANERTLIGGSASGISFSDLAALARATGSAGDPVVRQELSRSYIRSELLRYMGLRVRTALSQGQLPGPESSVMKLAISQHVSLNGDLALAMEGAAGMLQGKDALADGLWQQQFLSQWGVKIGGGTDQIQRNVIGERVLGLPGEPRPDRGLAFNELAKNG